LRSELPRGNYGVVTGTSMSWNWTILQESGTPARGLVRFLNQDEESILVCRIERQITSTSEERGENFSEKRSRWWRKGKEERDGGSMVK